MRGTLLTLLALGTIWAGLPSQETISVTASTTTQQQHDTKTKWLVSGTVDCMVDLDQGATTQPSIIMSGSCSDAPSVLLNARSWKAETTDEIAMLDDTGSEILRFGQDEQGGLISTAPRSVLVGLSPAPQR